MTADDFPVPAPGRPLWLITLADLALLLVGFFVLLQANQNLDKRALASGFRQGFGGAAKDTAPEPMPVAAAAMLDFAPGSATLPSTPDAIIAWAGEAAKDPRVRLTVTGATDGSPADIDPATGSAAVLAADRARAVAAALAPTRTGVAPGRLVITNAARPGRRQVVVTLDFAGEPK